MLGLRSDEQLVAMFRAGNDEAFHAIHDRYRRHLLAYVRPMLGPSRADAEDVLQDAFLRASRSLRAHDHELALRPWLYRITRNACIDELRRRVPAPCGDIERGPEHDPVAASEQRETFKRLVIDLERLPEQQRSALLMRELGGMSYTGLAEALGVSVPAVKSLLVRARLGLVESLEARETACADIRDELASAHARGMRPNALARRHLRDCPCCRQYRLEIRRTERQLAALAPTLGALGPLAKLFGIGGGGGAAAGGAASGGGVVISLGALGVSATHVASVVAAALIATASAVGLREATETSSTHASTHYPAAVVAAVPAVPTAAAISMLSHIQARSGSAAPSSSHPGSAGAADAATGSSSTGTITRSGPPTATTTPTGASPSTASSCPTGDSSCGQPKSSTPIGDRATTTPTGNGNSTLPATSGGTTTGSGASVSSGPGTSSDTPTGSSTASSTPLGGAQPSQTSVPPAGTTTSSSPLGS